MEYVSTSEPSSTVREEISELKKLVQELADKKTEENLFKKKGFFAKRKERPKDWDYPKRWKGALKPKLNPEKVLVWYLNTKGELERPKLVPLQAGNRVLIKGKPYDCNPESFITLEGKQKCLLIREIDRRPFCNLDWREVRERGDLTDSDEILLKTAMDSKIVPQLPMKKMGIALAVLAIAGIAMFVFSRGGTP